MQRPFIDVGESIAIAKNIAPLPSPGIPLAPTVDLCRRLITEEVRETIEAIDTENLVEIADGIADAIYVLLFAAHAYGLPMPAIWDEVHRTNMAKFPICTACNGTKTAPKGALSMSVGGGLDFDCAVCNGQGRTVIVVNGKFQKPPGWQPPNIARVLAEAHLAVPIDADPLVDPRTAAAFQTGLERLGLPRAAKNPLPQV